MRYRIGNTFPTLEIRAVGPAHLIERIREIGATRVRYGYRRINVLLRWERVAGQCKDGLPTLVGDDDPAIQGTTPP